MFSEQKSKKDEIPQPHSDLPAAYPKIDLKDIARYVSLYRNVAKKLFGEALDSAKKGINCIRVYVSLYTGYVLMNTEHDRIAFTTQLFNSPV